MRLALFMGLLAVGSFLSAYGDAGLPNGTGAPDEARIDDAWRLWLDDKAEWRNDKLFLPDEVKLAAMPVNAPTGGWDVLDDGRGIAVTLPGTVEEHYWGVAPLPVAGTRPQDVVGLSSPYTGVSWWWRSFTPPILKPGERLIFNFPGARLRAEVYVNGRLVGYNLVTEIPFSADATDALNPGGTNRLAVRITNPGGTFSWGDFGVTQWGGYHIPVSHGFGGIDGGVTMAVHGAVEVSDLAVLNTEDPRTITLSVEVASNGTAYKGPVALAIARDGKSVWNGSVDVDVPAGGSQSVSQRVTVPDAELWDVGHPVLYRASAVIASVDHSARVTDFGFRWFNAEGLGQNARLVLNGRRIVVKSAISWGYWAPNGMFPDASAVQREVDAARALGLNCVQNHRHFPKAAVLDGFDHAGLLRYCEPGGGGWSYEFDGAPQPLPKGPIDTSGQGGAPLAFINRYELAKVEAMIKAYRSHPSVIVWTLLNEGGADLHNPKIFAALRKMRELDPSRLVILKSGFSPAGEAMSLPYTDTWTFGDVATNHDSGWHDTHTCNDYEGVYSDLFYKGPEDHTYYTTESQAISAWGEMATGASVDDVTSIADWYRKQNVPGYDRAAAEALSTAYEKFIDAYGFRRAFPTAETLFQQIGNKHYFSAAKVMENARIADANDYIVLSGWESTTVDNHCALVDALRRPKGDPAILHAATAPELLVVRLLHYVVAKGDAAVVDVHLLNEVNRQGAYTLHVTAAMDRAKQSPFFTTTSPVNATGGETFAQLLKSGISFTPPAAGAVTVTAWLTGVNDATPLLQRTEPLLVVDPQPAPLTGTIACADFDGKLAPALKKQFGVDAVPLTSAPPKVDAVIISSSGAPRFAIDLNNLQRARDVQGTDDPGLFAEESVVKKGDLARYTGLAPGPATVELYFVDSYFDNPGSRSFDIALNGKTVLKNFDIIEASGGKNRATMQKLTADCPEGNLTVSVPRIGKDKALLAAIRITDASGKVTREVFRREAYTSPNGEVWNAVKPGGYDWKTVLPGALDLVRKGGGRLVLLTMGGDDAGDAAQALAQNGVLNYSGTLGFDKTSWLGYWYFGRRHPLLDGLPSDCVLDWPYQAAVGGDGLKIDGPGMEPVIAIGMNHSPALGFGAAVFNQGKGKVVLLAIPGLNPAFVEGDSTGFQPVTARRLIYNALSLPPGEVAEN